MHGLGYGPLDGDDLSDPIRFPGPNILREADTLTSGDRNDTYGHPAEDFARIAWLWTPVLGVKVTPQQVGLCMILLKVARECHQSKRDSLVDIAGYARCLEMLYEREESNP